MDERKELNAVPPAAAPEREKTYVKPAMQVFPLNCGLLAMSGVSGDPVYVTITGGISMYNAWLDNGAFRPCMPHLPATIGVDDIRSGFAGISLPMDALGYSDCCAQYLCFSENSLEGPSVQGLPEDWDVTDFLANVRLSDNPGFARDELSYLTKNSLEVEGSYKNRPVVIDFVLTVAVNHWR
ncbi:MAG: hypothetical protein IJ722_01015 [Alloprevotella sp.]|nr:hypothetical protein [Alloprevotella sp.]